MTGILFLVAVLAAVAAVIFFAQSRSTGAALLALKEEQANERKSTEGERAALKEAQAELKQRSQQLVELREKLNDQKKKVEQKQKSQPRAVREAELEEDLAHARQLAEQAHAAEQEARRQANAARAALEAKDAELRRAQEKVRELSLRPVAAEGSPDAQANAALIAAQNDARRSEEKAREAIARLGDLEAQLGTAREREQRLRDEQRKAKGRAETNNRAFLISKGELELSRERLAQAERRLWQAGIVLPKPPAPERPKATGPASADRPREEPPAGAAALESPAPAQPEAVAAPAAEILAVTTAALSEDASGEPQAVGPLRRRPAHAEG